VVGSDQSEDDSEYDSAISHGNGLPVINE